MYPFLESAQNDQLYRLILDNALDAFIAIDEESRILEWNKQAERLFGWSKADVLGMRLTATIIPERYKSAHHAGMQRFLKSGAHRLLGKRVEIEACRKNGSEFPVELTITPIKQDGRFLFSASLRDLSHDRELEQAFRHQAALTQSILDSMPNAVIVSDITGHLVLVNPAAQHLLNLPSSREAPSQSFQEYQLLQPDTKTPYAHDERPASQAIRGEEVNGMQAFVQHEKLPDGAWLSINARPLKNESGQLIGGVVLFHDITELRQRQMALMQQARLLHKQASLLDLSHDAILTRDMDDAVSFWNRGAEQLYGISKAEATGQNSHVLLQTVFPIPVEEIKAIVHEKGYWQGELRQRTKEGRELIVLSQWALELQNGQPWRYLETNTDITQQIHTEREFQKTQENYRLLIETSIDYAIIVTDAAGTIVSWNTGAHNLMGMSAEEAIGQPLASLFTVQDQNSGYPGVEMQQARELGRAEDVRWHMRRDGSRFWASGVLMPLWNEDRSLRGFVKIMRDQTTQRLAEEKTLFLANHDMLTGLPNRVHLSNQLHKTIARSIRTRIPFAALLLDLDRFKYVNDTYGHHTGDLLLREVAFRIQSSLRETDIVARLGGDEFVVIQSDASQPAAAEVLAQKLIRELGRPYQLDGKEIVSGASIGISTYPTDAANPVELLKHSDLALYRAKNAGRGNYHFYTSSLAAEQSWKEDREQALRQALHNHEFELYYQPQIDLASWKISTVEALLRWQASELDLILPDDFLDIAEESGLILEIGEWTLREACRQVKHWQGQGMPELRISINCSARQFSDPGFIQMIPPVLEEVGLTASSLELEITESMLARFPGIKESITRLRQQGVRVTIDNYGTGSTALIDLQEFEIDGLKIDKAFVQHLPHRRKDSAITSAIINLAHELGIGVTAGGVETAEQLAYLKARECTGAQGFIFSAPMPAQKFEELIKSGHWSRLNRLPSLKGAAAFKEMH